MSRRVAATWILALTIAAAGCPGAGDGGAPAGGAQADGGGEPGGGDPTGGGGTPHAAPAGDAAAGGAGDAPAGGAVGAGAPDHVLLAQRAAFADATLEAWVEQALELPPEAFVPIEPFKEQVFVYLVESDASAGNSLKPAFDPHRGAKEGAVWSIRAAAGEGDLDLIRCETRAEGYAVTLTEGRNVQFLILRPTAQPAPPLTQARLKALIEAVVFSKSETHDWSFELPADPRAGTHLISNVGAPPLDQVSNRDERADVLVVDGRVVFAFYKRIEQRIAFEPGETWFRASTRAAIAAARGR
jgi:hypothetical protein